LKLINGYDHLCASFVHSYVLLLELLLHWYIFVVSDVGFVYMCTLLVDWVRLCFWISVLACVYVCLFTVFLCSTLFCVLCIFYGCCDFSTPNKDIMRFRCGSGEVLYPFEHIFVKIFGFVFGFSSWF